MKTLNFALATLVVASLSVPAAHAQDALVGRVSSAEEGAMEGVLVSARGDRSTITITVVSDAQGQYRFPSARLKPGNYSLRIRAVG